MVSKPTKETLEELKQLMPPNHVKEIIAAYYKLYNTTISRWTVMNFFKGMTYSIALHTAILDVVSTQQSLNTQTQAIINA